MKPEWILLADRAEVINDKFYLLGGGWQTLTINQPLPIVYPFGIATAFAVDADDVGELFDISVGVSGPGEEVLAGAEAQIEIGRVPGVPVGPLPSTNLALNVVLRIERIGTHTVSVRVDDGVEAKRLFHVIEGPGMRSGEVSADEA